MKRVFTLVVVFSLLMTILPSFAGAQASNQRVILTFKDKVDKTVVTKVNGKVNREYKHIKSLAVTVPTSAINGLQKNPMITALEPDLPIKINQTADWGISRTEAPKAWNSNVTGKGVKVSIIDTGVAKHEDLIISGGASFVSYTSSFNDDNGHGTHVAGIVGARNNNLGTVGIAPEANIYAVKALDKNGSGYLSDVVAGIDWSITNRMDIINLSLGTTSHSPTLQQAVDKAYAENILVVAAAGNNGTSDGSGDTVNYPARYSSVIAVSATDSSDRRASFSATGSTIEVAAPGVSVLSTYLNNQYGRMSGTSMAAPYVAGNLALIKQANSTLSAKELRQKLQQGVVDLGAAGKDNWFGYGLIQAPQSVEQNQPAPLINTKTTVVTDKSVYKAGETVKITMTAYDEKGNVLVGANAEVVLYTPALLGYVYRGTTDARGQFHVSYKTSRLLDIKGTYTVEAKTSKADYTTSHAKTSFQLK